MALSEIYKQAAIAAHADGIKASNQAELVTWIRANCKYRPETEYFLALGIGCDLADIQAIEAGYKSEVDRAFQAAKSKLERPTCLNS